MFENEVPNWLPGQEPPEQQARLKELFDALDRAFPGRRIVWADWDHANWDRLASSLCRTLGYSRGAAFLTAYGYSIDVGGQVIPAQSRPRAAAAETAAGPEEKAAPAAGPEGERTPAAGPCWLTGSVCSILPNHNSGFVRGDNGRDYYFNVRDFTHWVTLSPGLRVRFRLEERMDHRRGCLRETAVSLTEIPAADHG